ncbi:MAG: hypothetical protein BroJett005_21920 [Ignavibacteriota bacterium]|nr:MAG: hypothetical protein BroJett005_21920 [Ignavibacteriota bacterium]
MDSYQYIKDIENIPCSDKYKKLDIRKLKEVLLKNDKLLTSIELSVGTELFLVNLFDTRNVPDDLFEAYDRAFTNSALSLNEHYSEMIEKGGDSVTGFIGNLKGKLWEIKLQEEYLPDYFGGGEFSISSNPIQKIFDITGTLPSGEEILIQAKMGAASYVSNVASRMEADPDVLFALSNEIQDKIIENYSHLSDQFLDLDVSNLSFTSDVSENLNILQSNFGIDVPDELGEILPYLGEIILGVKLIIDVLKTDKEFTNVEQVDKNRINGMKALLLIQRFGISSVCTMIGGAAGTAAIPIPILGTLVGAGGGATASYFLNKALKPHMLKIALVLVGLEEDDLFYLQNKNTIDELALNFSRTSQELAVLCG